MTNFITEGEMKELKIFGSLTVPVQFCAVVFLITTMGISYGLLPGRPTGEMPDNSPKISYFQTDKFWFMFDSLRGVARYAFPKNPIYFPTDSAGIIEHAKRFIAENSGIFGVSPEELSNPILTRRINRFWLTFKQVHQGIPVEDGTVYFRIFGDGRLWACGSKAIPRFDDPSPALSAERCEAIARDFVREHIGQQPGDFVGNPELVYLPEKGIGKLCWKFTLAGEHPDRFEIWVDAHTGRVIGWTNLVNYYDITGVAQIYYLPNFFDDPWDSAAFANGHISFNYVQSTVTDTTGYYYIDAWIGGVSKPLRSWLDGLYVDVDLMSGGEDALFLRYLTPPDTLNWTWTDELAQPDELNLYYHTDFIHSWYKHLDPGMTGLDYPVPARARVPDVSENAYWDGYGTNYGAGGTYTRNFALFANVIYHEYTHGVTGWIYRNFYFPYEGEAGAMNEAFSDYFACTITDYPYAAWRVSRDDSYFRNLDNDLVYPDDWVGEPHADSRMISGAFWDIRQALYPDRKSWADSLIHFTRYSGANTFNDFAIECFFTADDDGDISNGCENFALIANSFARHGIGPGHYPTLYVLATSTADSGDGDGYLEPGEEFTIAARVKYFVDFPYPPVNNLALYLQIEDSSITPVEPSVNVSSLANGDSVEVVFRFLVSEDLSQPHYVSYTLYYGTPDVPLTPLYTGEIAVGFPQVLLVNNSGTDDFTHYFTDALHDIQVVYDKIDASDSEEFPDYDYLSQFNTVLWFTGDAENSINSFQREAIAGYIASSTEDTPHNFILTGQDGFDGSEYEDFLADNFAARVSTDSVRAMTVLGATGDSLGEGFNVMIFGAAGANNQNSPSVIEPVEPSGTAFAFYNGNESLPAAVRHTVGTAKTVVFGFGLEATGARTTTFLDLAGVLRRLLEWFDVPLYSGIGATAASKPEEINLTVAPNPFNGATKFDIHTTGKFILKIYNLTGEEVFSTTGTGPSAVIWNPRQLGSGIYLYKLNAAGRILTGKVIYLK